MGDSASNEANDLGFAELQEIDYFSLLPKANNISQEEGEQFLYFYQLVLDRYIYLSGLIEPSQEESNQLLSIYKEAETDALLDLLLEIADDRINCELGLLDNKFKEIYDNQQAWLGEYIREIPFDSEHRKELQQILQEMQYYHGPIDGVLGKRSEEALKKLYEEVQNSLARKGFYYEKADGIIDEKSVAAVQRFQQSEKIKDDGALGKETLQKLIDSLNKKKFESSQM